VTENADPVIGSTTVDPRAEWLLDAGAALLVRLGYRRVTIEDVAREAGVGKGTVYLYFRTKEALFVTVLLREQRRVLGGMTDRMRADPAEAMPGRMMGSVYRALAQDPVARGIYLGDAETFGALAREAAGTLGELSARREVVLAEHLRLLREAGLLGTGLSVDAQRYLLSAVSFGFYLLGPDSMPGVPPDPGTRAELLEHAVASTLRTADATPSPALAVAVAAHYDFLITHLDHEWRARLLR